MAPTAPSSSTQQEQTMPTLDSYLFFDGQCADALRFYERTLGAKLQMLMTYGQSPDPKNCPPGDPNRVMHGCIALPDGRLLMASDTPQGMFKPMQGFALALNYASADEARKVFDAFAEGGQVVMPMGRTFWVEAFGMLTDRFGTPWMVSGGEQAQM
jgi:PhnB protein